MNKIITKQSKYTKEQLEQFDQDKAKFFNTLKVKASQCPACGKYHKSIYNCTIQMSKEALILANLNNTTIITMDGKFDPSSYLTWDKFEFGCPYCGTEWEVAVNDIINDEEE